MTDVAVPAALPDVTGIPTVVGLPDLHEWEHLDKMATMLAKSSIIPKDLRGKAEDVLIILLQARELRVPTVMALNKINVIDGTPSASAELMGALIKREGHEIGPAKDEDGNDLVDDTRATVRYRRKEWPEDQHGEYTWTIEDAERAELLDMWFDMWDGQPGQRYRKFWRVPKTVTVKHPAELTAADLEAAGAPEWVTKMGPGQVKYKDPWWKYPQSMLYARAVSQVGRMEFPDVLMGVSLTPEELGAEVDPLTGEIVNAPADDAVTTALLARARSLPDRFQADLRDWFGQVQCPPITRLPTKWVDAVEAKIASYEQWVVDGQVVDTAPPEPPTDGPTVIDTTATATAAPSGAQDEPQPPSDEDTPPDPPEPEDPHAVFLTMDRDTLIAKAGKTPLRNAIEALGGTPPDRASMEELADLYLSVKPFDPPPT